MPAALLPLPPLAEQAERLIEVGAYEIGGVTAAQLRDGAQANVDRGLLVMHSGRAYVSRLASLIERDGKRGDGIPVLRPAAGGEAECGREMRIVDDLAARWGYQRGGGFATTWFELD